MKTLFDVRNSSDFICFFGIDYQLFDFLNLNKSRSLFLPLNNASLSHSDSNKKQLKISHSLVAASASFYTLPLFFGCLFSSLKEGFYAENDANVVKIHFFELLNWLWGVILMKHLQFMINLQLNHVSHFQSKNYLISVFLLISSENCLS